MAMTVETIEAAFAEYRKTLTVVDKPASFDSFAQGYVAGWNAHEESEKCARFQWNGKLPPEDARD